MCIRDSVRRNIKRFPEDFMFQLTKEEMLYWRSQIVTSKGDKMGLRYQPMAFTEQGVAMLSTVLNSERAIDVNIQIMRTFTMLRQMISSHAELKSKIEDMEKKYDDQFRIVFDAIRELLKSHVEPEEKNTIGFNFNDQNN